jgi:hypothetical protein
MIKHDNRIYVHVHVRNLPRRAEAKSFMSSNSEWVRFEWGHSSALPQSPTGVPMKANPQSFFHLIRAKDCSAKRRFLCDRKLRTGFLLASAEQASCKSIGSAMWRSDAYPIIA